MQTAIQLQLLQDKISLPDLTIGQAMDIAKIPERFNEKRLSALITHLTNDAELADLLTVQERYYILLNQQMLAEHKYSEQGDQHRYLLPTIESDVPDSFEHPNLNISIQHLRGKHVCVLETQCENLFDWLCGQMACQLYGDIFTQIMGEDNSDDKYDKWEAISVGLTENEINELMQNRVAMLTSLPEYIFNYLVTIYSDMLASLTHFVDISNDNQGITLLSVNQASNQEQNTEGLVHSEPARFLTLAALRGTASQLAKLIT
ncbi:hypothetical protein [Psychrobacter sp. I-STPA10]|uniref:hypothetical protein n=1 Tax=Psychrobacter sp. I-STPA10 TaxID=2585769 RepID=UPI001E459714|nr:hypothetical protein [Psychrobacter sp. I-STPA10]